jgi:hypothetical protein
MLVEVLAAVMISKMISIICELAGIITSVVPAAMAPPERSIAWDCAITTCPTFFMSVPTVVPVVSLMVPALIGPEKVVELILFSYER